MVNIVPPYMNKQIEMYQKEVFKAEKKELEAKKKYEFAQEYTNLCKVKLEDAKQEDKN